MTSWQSVLYANDKSWSNCVIEESHTLSIFRIRVEILRDLTLYLLTYLIVGVSSDEYVLEKGKKPIQTLEERVKYVESLPYVDKVIVEYTTDEQ